MAESSNLFLGSRYEVRSLIGRGGMAEVHLGFDTRLSRIIAIKMLRSDLARDTVFQTRFRREAQAAASLNHPNIVAVYDTGEESLVGPDGRQISIPYIVMEYVEGHTVKDLLADGTPVPIDEAINICEGILAALEYSHAAHLVHRDIKPGNIMLTNDGKVKVMDFGIARAMSDSQATMTQTNAVVGTAQYLSPEQARGEQVDTRSDLYSTGVLLFELLTGRPPFKGDTAVIVAYQHVSAAVPAPSTIAPDIPESIDRVVLKAMAKDRDKRYQSARAMREDLQRAHRGVGVHAPSTSVWATPPATLDNTATQALSPTATLPPGRPNPQPAQINTTEPKTNSISNMSSKKKSKWPLLISLMVLAILCLAGAIFFAINNDSHSNSVAVPDVVGSTKDEAQAAIEKVGLKFEAVPEKTTEVEPDKVIETTPKAGEKLEKGKVVTVKIAETPDSVAIPNNVVGQDPATVRQMLQKLRIPVESTDYQEASDTVLEGKVTRTDPSPGSPVAVGSNSTPVRIFVSAGSDSRTIPAVAGMSEEDAGKELEKAKIKVSNTVQLQDDPSQPEGRVTGTNPAAGSKINKNDVVTIYVSSGNVKIPAGLAGRQTGDVRKTLNDLTLTTNEIREESESVPAGEVIRLSREAGETVKQRSNVDIYVSSGARSKAPTVSPSPGSTRNSTVKPTVTVTPKPDF